MLNRIVLFLHILSAIVQVLTKDEGGRYTPFMEHYRPQIYIRTADISVGLLFPEGTPDHNEKMVMPGDNVELVCDLVHDVAAEVGTRCVHSCFSACIVLTCMF